MTARRFMVRGRVQGVGFRWFVMREAAALGLDGWVRNLPDGTVEVRVQGAIGSMDTLADRLQAGPPSSRVEGVYASECPPEDGLRGFRVRS